MMRIVLTLTALVTCVRPGQSSSLPTLCQNVECGEGTLCMEIRSEPCANVRSCPPTDAQCVPVSTKEGVCPRRLENPQCRSLYGLPLCWVDSDCDDNLKCCDGCCKTPDAQLTIAEQLRLTKPGNCPDDPDSIAYKRLWTLKYCEDNGSDVVDKCLSDFECLRTDKCCQSLCGNECKPVIHIAASTRLKPAEEDTGDSEEPLVNPGLLGPIIQPTRPPPR